MPAVSSTRGLLHLTLHVALHLATSMAAVERPSNWPRREVPEWGCSLLQVRVSVSQAPCKLCKPSGSNSEAVSALAATQPPLAGSSSVVASHQVGILGANDSNATLATSQQALPWFSASPAMQRVRHAVARHVTGGKAGLSAGAWVGIAIAIFFGLLLIPLIMVATWLLSKRGLRRQIHFWWHAYPIYRDYITAFKAMPTGSSEEEFEKAFAPLHKKYAPVIVDIILDMGGMFVKFAQGLSAMPDKLPQAYREQFARCTTQCKALDFEQVKGIIEAELQGIRSMRDLCGLCMPGAGGGVFESTFTSFDVKPLAAASIGQVHRACLRGLEERPVVVKVQRPGAREIFQADISCLVTLGEWAESAGANSWGLMAAKEFDKQIQQEFDYLQEASNVEIMRGVLFPEFADRVALPEVIRDLTSERMLTMTFLEGVGLDKAFRARVAKTGVDANKILKLMSTMGDEDVAEAEAAVEAGAEGAEAKAGSARVQAEGSGRAAEESKAEGEEAGAGAGAGSSTVAADYGKAVQTMLEIYGFCVLAKGIYNADPHPGNVLLMPDGRLGLVDFGQVKRMHDDSRASLSEVIVGVVSGDQAKAVGAMKRMGIGYTSADASVETDDIAWHQALSLWGKMPVIPFPTHIKAGQANRDNAADLPMLIRTVFILRGVALAFGSWVSVAEVWLPWAAESPEEADRLGALAKAVAKKNLSGNWTMTHQTTGEEVSWVFRQPPGQQFFFATQGGSGQAWPNGHVRGRSVEWKCSVSGTLWRGSLDDAGERLGQVQCFAPDEKYLGVHTGVLVSGKVGRVVNTAKGASSTLCFAFKAARAARSKS